MDALTIVFRLLHVIGAVVWVGGAFLLTLFILPAIGLAGPIGGQFMQIVTQKTKLIKFMPSIGGVTVLSGFVLFWRDTAVSGGSFAGSPAGITFSVGGLAGLVGLVVGSIMTSRSAKELGAIGATAVATGAPPSSEQARRIDLLRARMKSGSVISLTLLMIATTAMAVARYV